MTAVPDPSTGLIALICDHCGTADAGRGNVLRDPEVVWPLLTEHGWSGSPLAEGRHRCPSCTTQGGAARVRTASCRSVGPHLAFDVEATVAVVAVTGDVDVRVADALRERLVDAVDAYPDVVMDMSAVHTIDSVGLGILVRARQHARQRDHRFWLAAPSRFVVAVLHTMRLHHAFPMFESREQALSELLPAVRRTDASPSGRR